MIYHLAYWFTNLLTRWFMVLVSLSGSAILRVPRHVYLSTKMTTLVSSGHWHFMMTPLQVLATKKAVVIDGCISIWNTSAIFSNDKFVRIRLLHVWAHSRPSVLRDLHRGSPIQVSRWKYRPIGRIHVWLQVCYNYNL